MPLPLRPGRRDAGNPARGDGLGGHRQTGLFASRCVPVPGADPQLPAGPARSRFSGERILELDRPIRALLGLCLALIPLCATAAAPRKTTTTAPAPKAPPLRVVKLDAYRKQVGANPDLELVDLAKFIPGIQLDLRYATRNNFMGRPLYDTPRALLRRPVAERLLKVQAALAARGIGLRIFDAYRPYSVTVEMWRSKKAGALYISPPSIGSQHNRGTAVDLTLFDLKTGKPLPMPTDFDEFSPRAAHAYTQLDPQRIENRRILKETMVANGFYPLLREWWHYGYRDWQRFDVLDVPLDAVP